MSFPAAFQCRKLIECGRLHDALCFLNARTRHRYTGLYLFDPPMLRNFCIYDRENPGVTRSGDTPMTETYCSLVWGDATTFATSNALQDGRLDQHPLRADVLAYCGVPVFTPDGQCIASLCHFDTRPRLVPISEVPILLDAARAIGAASDRLGLMAEASAAQRLAGSNSQ
jgi:GAF domain-containing protein